MACPNNIARSAYYLRHQVENGPVFGDLGAWLDDLKTGIAKATGIFAEGAAGAAVKAMGGNAPGTAPLMQLPKPPTTIFGVDPKWVLGGGAALLALIILKKKF